MLVAYHGSESDVVTAACCGDVSVPINSFSLIVLRTPVPNSHTKLQECTSATKKRRKKKRSEPPHTMALTRLCVQSA